MPVPSLVLVAKATVGSVVVPQQTPLAVTALEPIAVTFPPLVAVVPNNSLTAVVAARVAYGEVTTKLAVVLPA